MISMTREEIHAISNLCNDIVLWCKKVYNYYFEEDCKCDCCIKAKNKKD